MSYTAWRVTCNFFSQNCPNPEQSHSVVPRGIPLNKSQAILICGSSSFSFLCHDTARSARNLSWSACFVRSYVPDLPVDFGTSVKILDAVLGCFSAARAGG